VNLTGPVTSDDFVNLKKRLLDSRGIRGQSLLFVEWTRYAVRLVRIGFFKNLTRQWIQLSVVFQYLSLTTISFCFVRREESRDMFYHAFNAYMDNAYPADELMPLSCKGRFRGREPNRGDIDDALGK
jgi:hypothetical protein